MLQKYIGMLHMLQWLYIYVSGVFQMFHLFFETYVYKYFIWMLRMFLQVFQTYVPGVSVVFVRMLPAFHLDVSKVDLVLQQAFHMHISNVSSIFIRILQVLHLNVSKVDRMFTSPSSLSTSHRCLFLLQCQLGIHRPLPPLSQWW